MVTTQPKYVWKVPAGTLSGAGRLVVLRGGDGDGDGAKREQDVRAEITCDEEMRGVVFGDPVMREFPSVQNVFSSEPCGCEFWLALVFCCSARLGPMFRFENSADAGIRSRYDESLREAHRSASHQSSHSEGMGLMGGFVDGVSRGMITVMTRMTDD